MAFNTIITYQLQELTEQLVALGKGLLDGDETAADDFILWAEDAHEIQEPASFNHFLESLDKLCELVRVGKKPEA